MRLNKKAQVSFEVLLITAIVFAMAIWVSSYYLEIKDSTLALQFTKIHTLKQIENSPNTYTIEKIDFEETAADAILLKINTSPNDFQCDGFSPEELAQTITNNSKYTAAAIELNGIPC